MLKSYRAMLSLLLIMVFASFIMVGCSNGTEDVEGDTTASQGGSQDESLDQDTPDDGQRIIKVGYTPPTYDTADFYGQFGVGLWQGLKELGIEYEEFTRSPADHTAHEQQLAIIEDFLAMDIDYVVMAPTSYEGQQTAYQLMNDENVPFIIGNYSQPFPEEFGSKALSYVGYSHADGGQVVVDYIKENYPVGTQMAIIHFVPGHLDDERTQIEQHKANGMEIVYDHWADGDRNKAFEGVQRLLQTYPDVKIILAANSYMALGAVEAIAAEGRQGEIDVFGAGGILEELDAIERGEQKATWFRDPLMMGRQAAENIYLHMNGREDEIQESYNVPIIIIDSVESIIEYVNPVTYTGVGREFPSLD